MLLPAPLAAQALPGAVRPPAGTFERENRAAEVPLSTPRTPFTIDRPRTDPNSVDDTQKVRVTKFRITGFNYLDED
ncbi:hypothetical protein, partial [Erythrobacter donghaensis]